jgi:hypothetical protein
MIGAARLWVIVAGRLKKLNQRRALPHLSREKILAICGRDGRLGVLRQLPASSDIFFRAWLAGWLGAVVPGSVRVLARRSSRYATGSFFSFMLRNLQSALDALQNGSETASGF